MKINNEQFIHAYMVAALWSSTGDDGSPLDDDHDPDDIAPATVEKMRADCLAFITANAADLESYAEQRGNEQWSGSELAGHDFWLTRNGHGVGFWDRGLDELGDRLTRAADNFPTIGLYAGDDGKVHAE